jgi:hypothetical protein
VSVDGRFDPVYFKSIRKMAVAFATIFNSIWLIREDNDGVVVTKEKVPLVYGPKQHWHTMLTNRLTMRSQTKSAEISSKLPAISFFLSGLAYDAGRQINPMHVTRVVNENVRIKQLQPAPYNLTFELMVWSKNMEDGLMILEQILPLFTPQLNLKILEVEELEKYSDITITLNSVTPDDNYMSGLDENRLIAWNLSFNLSGYIYPPFVDQQLIKKVIVDFDHYDLDNGTLEKIMVEANQFDPPDFDKDNSTVAIEHEIDDPKFDAPELDT